MTTDTGMLTQAQIEFEISRLSQFLGVQTEVYAEQAVAAAQADHFYKSKAAGEYLEAKRLAGVNGEKVTVKDLDSKVQQACDAEHLEKVVAGAKADATKEVLRSVSNQLSALQSLLRAVKDQT